jgi:hypothetical protein
MKLHFFKTLLNFRLYPPEEREKRMSHEVRNLADYTKRLTANIGQINTAAMVVEKWPPRDHRVGRPESVDPPPRVILYGRIEHLAHRIFEKKKTKIRIERCFLPTAVFHSFGFKNHWNFGYSELQYAF